MKPTKKTATKKVEELLKDAIADAQTVRDTALENARLALAEAFQPKLHQLFSRAIREEDEEDTIPIEDEPIHDDEELAEDDDFDADDEEVPVEEPIEEDEDFDLDDEEEVPIDEPIAEEDEFPVEDEEVPEDLDLAEIIRELEAEEEDYTDTDEEPAMDAPIAEEDEELDFDVEDDEVPTEEPIAEEDEELDFDVEDDELTEDEDFDADDILNQEDDIDSQEEIAELKTQLSEQKKINGKYAKALTILKSRLTEINLLNTKLLYANKLFKTYNLSNNTKMKVIENLDRAKTEREVKLVYAALAESVTAGAKRRLPEGLVSKTTKTTKPSEKILNENVNELAQRWQHLARIGKKNKK